MENKSQQDISFSDFSANLIKAISTAYEITPEQISEIPVGDSWSAKAWKDHEEEMKRFKEWIKPQLVTLAEFRKTHNP